MLKLQLHPPKFLYSELLPEPTRPAENQPTPPPHNLYVGLLYKITNGSRISFHFLLYSFLSFIRENLSVSHPDRPGLVLQFLSLWEVAEEFH